MLEIIDYICNPHNPNMSFLEFAVKQGLIEFFLNGVLVNISSNELTFRFLDALGSYLGLF